MAVIAYLHAALVVRLAELRQPEERERGDSPVPTAVIIMGLAFVATIVTGLALARAQGWMNSIPTPGNPQAPAGNP